MISSSLPPATLDVGMNDEYMTKKTPIILISLLVAGAIIFAANGFFLVPIETYFALAGGLVFVSGMIFGVIASVRSIIVISRPDLRQISGIILPALVLIITTGTWLVVVTTLIQVNRSLEERERIEIERMDILREKTNETSQPGS